MDDEYELLAQLHRALAHPVRLQILDILSREEACVCHMTAVLGQRQPYVSQQLAALRDAGLVVLRREGTLVYYRLRDARLAAMIALGKSMLPAEGAIEAVAFKPLPEGAVVGCPCPRCQGRIEAAAGLDATRIAAAACTGRVPVPAGRHSS
jgi:DNA-binding transcriptional ArsR family regulator